MSSRLRIAVVGAGTAGAAAATLLARQGHVVTVLERVVAPRAVGAGITLQPTGQAALHALGVLDEVVAHGAPVDRLTCRLASGRPLIDLPYAAVDARLVVLGVHRGALFRVLLAALQAAGAELRCGVTVVSSQLDGAGRWLVTAEGERLGPYDLVVAADGSVSELHACMPRVTSRAYPWGALWLVAEDTAGFTAERRIHQIVDGAHTMLGFLPTGLAPREASQAPGAALDAAAAAACRKQVVSLFWSIRADRVEAWRAAGLPAWRDRVLALEPRAEGLLDSITSLEPVLFARYRDVAMWPWHGERIVFLGDAAHATSPQLGQGANLALLDALALAEVLAASLAELPGDRALPAALIAYSRARRRQLAFYQLATRALTPLFQSDSRLLAWLRDRAFPMSRWLSPLRYRMVRTMLGVDRGLLRAPLPLSSLRPLPERLCSSMHSGTYGACRLTARNHSMTQCALII